MKKLVLAGLVLLGLALCLWPSVCQQRYQQRVLTEKAAYQARISEMAMPYPALYQAMLAYNEALAENGQAAFCSEEAYQQPSFVLADYGMPEETLGWLDIPSLELTLPLLLGASEAQMEQGAAHLTGTSLPLDTPDSHCVIAAHRGHPTRQMFRHLDRLAPGDEVYLTTPWQRLGYRVCAIEVVEPTDTARLLIQPGRQLLTLMTCHPYPTNRYRLLVLCELVSVEDPAALPGE
ncbi:MAG: class C sortase [Gemmiger sp.]